MIFSYKGSCTSVIMKLTSLVIALHPRRFPYTCWSQLAIHHLSASLIPWHTSQTSSCLYMFDIFSLHVSSIPVYFLYWIFILSPNIIFKYVFEIFFVFPTVFFFSVCYLLYSFWLSCYLMMSFSWYFWELLYNMPLTFLSHASLFSLTHSYSTTKK